MRHPIHAGRAMQYLFRRGKAPAIRVAPLASFAVCACRGGSDTARDLLTDKAVGRPRVGKVNSLLQRDNVWRSVAVLEVPIKHMGKESISLRRVRENR